MRTATCDKCGVPLTPENDANKQHLFLPLEIKKDMPDYAQPTLILEYRFQASHTAGGPDLCLPCFLTATRDAIQKLI